MDALACRALDYRTKVICVLSAAGNERTISRLRAVLQSNVKVQMKLSDMPSPFWRYDYKPIRFDGGYTIYKTKLDYNQWHILAVAKGKGLLPAVSDEALWQELRSERYTTPVLRPWVPWLQEQMLEVEHLGRLDCFQCDAAWLDISHGELDDLVSEGIKHGALEVK